MDAPKTRFNVKIQPVGTGDNGLPAIDYQKVDSGIRPPSLL